MSLLHCLFPKYTGSPGEGTGLGMELVLAFVLAKIVLPMHLLLKRK
jgi:hypothetical protein